MCSDAEERVLHFQAAGVQDIEPFITGTVVSPQDEVRAINRAVGAMKEIKR